MHLYHSIADATIPQVIKALDNFLQYFGGAVSLKTDNMKQVITKSYCYERILKGHRSSGPYIFDGFGLQPLSPEMRPILL